MMIEKIIAKLDERRSNVEYMGNEDDYFMGKASGFTEAIEIVKKVAKKHGRTLNRCDTCIHYIADKVPNVCYFCCKGMEDNYEQKGE